MNKLLAIFAITIVVVFSAFVGLAGAQEEKADKAAAPGDEKAEKATIVVCEGTPKEEVVEAEPEVAAAIAAKEDPPGPSERKSAATKGAENNGSEGADENGVSCE